MSKPFVSVLMPTYNHGEFVTQAIESVLAQELTNFELVICDDGSSDQTPEIAAEYARRDPRVRFFRNPNNLGLSANYNRCYRAAQPESPYLIVLPSDDWWNPGLLQALVDTAEQHPQAAFVHCGGYRVRDEGRQLNSYMEIFNPRPEPGLHRAVKELYCNNYVLMQGTLIRRSALRRFYPHPYLCDEDLTFVSDYLLWTEILTRGGQAYYLPEQLVYFRDHPGSHTIPLNDIPRTHEEVTLFEKKLDKITALDPELERARREALAARLAGLGFHYLENAQLEQARPFLERAARFSSRFRLDVTVARAIMRLPLPQIVRSQLWHLALFLSQRLQRWGPWSRPQQALGLLDSLPLLPLGLLPLLG